MTGYAYHHETRDGVPCIRLTADAAKAIAEAEGAIAVVLTEKHATNDTVDFFPNDISYHQLNGAIERAKAEPPVEAYDVAMADAIKQLEAM